MELHNNNGEVTVIIDVSFSEEIATIKEFIREEAKISFGIGAIYMP